MDFKRINSYKELLGLVGKIKQEQKICFSNIYPNPGLYQDSIDKGLLFFIKDECLLVFQERMGFMRVYFATSNINNVLSSLEKIKVKFDVPLVLEHVIRRGKDLRLGQPADVLMKMIHTGLLSFTPNNRDVCLGIEIRDAARFDFTNISQILNSHFNPLKERIPDKAGLENLILNGNIKLAVSNGKIVGFIIFQKEGTGLHLRYWWMDPDFRGQGIGSRLMKEFVQASEGTARQYLWVFEHNDNAIAKYCHYGFEFDGTADDIYIINNK